MPKNTSQDPQVEIETKTSQTTLSKITASDLDNSPTVIHFHIMSFLAIKDLLRLSQVNHKFLKESQDFKPERILFSFKTNLPGAIITPEELHKSLKLFTDHPNLGLTIDENGNKHITNDQTLEAISKLLGLRDLNLSYCQLITENGVKHLESLKIIDSLTLLNCNLTDGSLATIAQLPLSELDLSFNNNITDAGIVHFAQNETLQIINLCGNRQITNNALISLKNCPLITLNLHACGFIDDEGLASIAQMEQLQSLQLYGCGKITPEGIMQLASLPKLEYLGTNNCKGLGQQYQRELESNHEIQAFFIEISMNLGIEMKETPKEKSAENKSKNSSLVTTPNPVTSSKTASSLVVHSPAKEKY